MGMTSMGGGGQHITPNQLAMIDELQGLARSPQSRWCQLSKTEAWALTTLVVQSWQTLRNGRLITRAHKVLEKG